MAVLFPELLHGSFWALESGARAAAVEWSHYWRGFGEFPEPSLSEVATSAAVHVCMASDLERDAAHWRLYVLSTLCDGICEQLDYKGYQEISAEFELHLQQWAWGSLHVALVHDAPNSIDAVARRLRGLVSHWDELNTLRYVGPAGPNAVPLTELIRQHVAGSLAMWLGCEVGTDLKADLDAAAANMEAAVPDAVRQRIVDRLLELAPEVGALRENKRLRDRPWVEDQLHGWDDLALRRLSGGYDGALLGALYDLDEAR